MSGPIHRSNETYNHDYALYYDKISGHKDYRAEVASLAGFMERAGKGPPAKVLDVGCGTGVHAGLLSGRGYEVTAVDVSPDMVKIAAARTPGMRAECCDISELTDGNFNFAYSLFNVINCLGSMEELIGFFLNISQRLASGGSFLIEGWNPIAVIAAPPEIVERTYESPIEKIVRKVVPVTDFLRQRLDLQYDIDVFSLDASKISKQFSVVHRLVLFTPLEVEYCLKRAGFKNIEVRTALPEMKLATAADRMLAFSCEKSGE